MRIAVAFALTGLAAPALAAPAVADQKPVAGTTLRVVEVNEFTHQVLLGSRLLYVDRDNRFVRIEGVYESDGKAFALIAEASGGNGCAGMFRAVEVAAKPVVSAPFGTCSDTPTQAGAAGGALTVVLPRMDGQANEVFRFAAGRLSKTVQPVAYRPGGPEAAPGNDLAALVSGKYIQDAAGLRAVADALSRVMGARMFTASRKRVQGGVGMPFEAHGDVVAAKACAPHNCGSEETGWAFDHAGHAWASWTQGGRTTFFGDPPPAVRAALVR